MDKNIKYYQIMHKYGKLISCDANNPAINDKMFIEELLGKIKSELYKSN